jgi:hypothetical protein
MKDCDKFKKKFYLGMLIIFIMGLLKFIDSNLINIIDILGRGLFIGLVMVLLVSGLYLSSDYLKCITNNNKIGKPPRY